MTSRLQFLGIQEAARKRRIDEGPWAGGIYSTHNDKMQKYITLAKWQKAKNYLKELTDEVARNPNGGFSYKLLELIRGFFYHLALVYEIFFPFLKGFHLTLAQHLPKRNEEGWNLT